ncbi:MAG: response regulator [Patescibacteria group bacterium]
MKKIFIIDDEESIVEALTLLLEDVGYTVFSAKKGKDILQNVRETSPDIILLDLLLSGLDGREICLELKNQSETKEIPLIMVSAHPSAEKSAKEAGSDNFLAKPFETEELLALLDQYLSKKK